MSNSILSLNVQEHRVDTAEADIRIRLVPERMTPAREVRGKFVGARCATRSTVEVAYRVRPLAADAEGPSLRGVIRAPCLWTATAQFEYEGRVELWEADQRCDVRILTLRLGQRTTAPQPS